MKTGNTTEYCGGSNRLNLYASGTTQPSVRPTSNAPPPPGGWFALGCYNDTVGTRSLSNTQYLQVPMTIEACTSACFTAGYSLAGLEYGGEYVIPPLSSVTVC